MFTKKKTIIIEIIVAIILLALLITKAVNPFSAEMTYNGNSEWVSYSANGQKLSPGTYTVEIEYSTDKELTAQLYSAERTDFVRANDFYLSPNRHQVSYDFFTSHSLYDLETRISESEEIANYSIDRVVVSSNTHLFRVLLFSWIVVCIIVNILCFSSFGKNNRELIIKLSCITLLSSIVLFFPGLVKTHDYRFHVIRIESIVDGLRAGEFPVRIHSTYGDGIGYPNGVFYGDLFLYVPAILRIIGFSVNMSYKIYVLLINGLTVFTAYLCGKKVFKKESTAIVTSLVYVTASYRIIDLYVRSSVGEYTALAFYPLIALAVWNIYKDDIKEKSYIKNAYILAVGMLGVLYSHVLSTEMVAVVLVVVCLSLFKKTFRKETILVYIRAIIVFFLMGAAFIVPFLDYYINTNTFIKERSGTINLIQPLGAYATDYFSFFKDFFGDGDRYMSARMQITPGLVLMLGLLAAGYVLIKRRATKEIKYLFFMSVILLIVASNIFPWNEFAYITKTGRILSQIQFPWRYVGIAVVPLTLLLGLVLEQATEESLIGDNAYKYIIVVSILMMCLFCGYAEKSDDNPKLTYDQAELDTSLIAAGNGEYLLSGTDRESISTELICENAEGFIVGQNGTKIVVAVEADEAASVCVPRFNYPYYKAIDESGNNLSISKGQNNLIKVALPDGYKGTVTIRFVSPWYWRVSEIVSLITAVGLLWLNFRKEKKH